MKCSSGRSEAVKKIKVEWQESNWLERPPLLFKLLPRIAGRPTANFNFFFSRAGSYLLSNSSAAASSELSLLFIVWFVSRFFKKERKRNKTCRMAATSYKAIFLGANAPEYIYLGHMNVQSLLPGDIKEKRRVQIQKLFPSFY